MKLSNEAKVGGLVFGTGTLVVLFAWVIGVNNPFKRTVDFFVTYNFAGGIEVGSPVRVSGIKVGQVEEIEFFQKVPASTVAKKIIDEPTSDTASDISGRSSQTQSLDKPVAKKEPGSADQQEDLVVAPVRLRISVLKKAAAGVKRDSNFYINMAGIIGERYVEITPGSQNSSLVEAGQTLAGTDPPRIDQLISQSFNLAGKISDIVEDSRGDLTKSVKLLYKLSANLNETLKWVDKSKLLKTDISLLVNNMIAITADMRKMTSKVNTAEGKQTLDLMYRLLWRLEPLDKKNISKFLQREGVKVKMF